MDKSRPPTIPEAGAEGIKQAGKILQDIVANLQGYPVLLFGITLMTLAIISFVATAFVPNKPELTWFPYALLAVGLILIVLSFIFHRPASASPHPETGAKPLATNGESSEEIGLPPLSSNLKFLKTEPMKSLLIKMRQVAETSDGLFIVDFGNTTANLYWQINGKRLRFLALERSGQARIWIDYIRKAGYEELAGKLGGIANPIVPIHGRSWGTIGVRTVNIPKLLILVDDLANAIRSEKNARG